ncbi:MAG: phasin family protein [Pseudomonadota bacterium]
MYSNVLEMAHKSLKPVVQIAENNTALAVKLVGRQSDAAVKLLEGNLAHLQALSSVEDFNGAVELQQKYVESLTEDYLSEARESSAAVEEAMTEAGKIFEGSWKNVQDQVKEAAETVKAEVKKAGKKAA